MTDAPHTYVKKPVRVQAMQYTEATRKALIAWCDAGHTGIDDDGCEYETAHLRLTTLHGQTLVRETDWVIRGPSGDFWPCKHSIFEATYEPI